MNIFRIVPIDLGVYYKLHKALEINYYRLGITYELQYSYTTHVGLHSMYLSKYYTYCREFQSKLRLVDLLYMFMFFLQHPYC